MKLNTNIRLMSGPLGIAEKVFKIRGQRSS